MQRERERERKNPVRSLSQKIFHDTFFASCLPLKHRKKMTEQTDKNLQAISKVLKKVKFGLLQFQEKAERSFTFGVLDKNGEVVLAKTLPAEKLQHEFNGNLLKNERFAHEVRTHDPKTTHPVYVSLADGGFEAAVISTVAYSHTLFVPIGPNYYDFDLGNSEGSRHLCQQYRDYLATREWKNLRVSTNIADTDCVNPVGVRSDLTRVLLLLCVLWHCTTTTATAGGVRMS